MVISGGIVTPPDRRPLAEQEAPKTSAATFEDIEIFREKERRPYLSQKKNKTIVPRLEFKLSSPILRPNEKHILNFAINGHPHLVQKGRGAPVISALVQIVIQDLSRE